MDFNAQLAQQHRADLHAGAAADHLAAAVKPAAELRTRVGWTLVGLGLRLVSAPRPNMALAR
ncbi:MULTISPECIES: hypothetical protein [unclassified Streptomyces]|uniref:hypothetical protein n=1 Tax=unclassified Streptomyces TaxID=2593676 RepID=UPI000DB8FBA1|nr:MULTISPECIES: hypothetical protein [Streptomyces]MYU03136.1 hypothetical protein [Streptomyces sp. SID8366]MYU64450.1 hypothetical protein [Streptomyces sp. SID69]RAJ57044.1 hypothetical protein K376_03929 [Streptomyces sp. PsTaAH-130]TXJ80016.1 hypothetical protein E2C11_11585 [Streptomyces lavendulae]